MGWKDLIDDKNSSEYGTLDASVSNGIYYEIVLVIYFFIISIISIIFLIISKSKRNQFCTGNSKIKLQIFFIFLSDIVIVFLEPLFLMMHEKLYITHEFVKEIKKQSYQIKLWIFISGFLLTALGDAIWIKTNIFLGPYNSIVPNFQKMTKWNYISSRISIDIIILIPGILISLSITSINWDLKSKFFLDYLNVGTIFFIICFGPVVHFIQKFIDLLIGKIKKSRFSRKIFF
ncbi:SPE_1075/MLC_0560 family membrane protein [Spiroplasma taiwanense]|uniref:Transmembrane protein n=1 Tax=Spiroplasma taiwanense CT-1 TaxID=1276220 RepID=S5MB74_9MOLU|nr:hypothetical protein [Spiroplasma taiwanense]AGR41023.1 hypothetical protein STAIW_v1c03730 [Spiroplasma taiwanense CT-1]